VDSPRLAHAGRGIGVGIEATEHGPPASDKEVAFLCECGDPRCNEYVKLTLAEHDARRRDEGLILVAGHRAPSAERAGRAA
jgi:hypothetical protein